MLGSGPPLRRAWSLGVSLILQCAFVALLLVLPLFYTYRLPLEMLGRATTLLLPPPPPAPPPPPTVKVTPQAPIHRFDAVLRQPREIPRDIALIDEEAPSVSALRPPEGTQGGVIGGLRADFAQMAGIRPPAVPKPIMVGGRVQAARLLNRVVPAYPLEAWEQHVAGRVLLRAVIGTDGVVKDLRVIEGDPLLVTAAIEAVSQWRYKPTLLNGAKVEVLTEIEVDFKIIEPPDEGKNKKKRRR